MARIYLSSTYRDLTDYREVVYRTLRQLQHDVIAMEDYVATDARPLDKCLQDVAGCDLYVGIFAFSYGYVPDDGNPEHKSITELEYRKASEVGIPRLVFIVKEGTSWPTNLLDAMAGEDRGHRIDAFRSELKKEHTDSFFESPEELARKVSVAVQQELARTRFEKLHIDWQGAYRRFIEHMKLFAGAHSDQEALRRYFHLRLQATGARAGKVLPAGNWNELVRYPAKILLTGEPGSGKTTLLLYESHRLSAKAREDSRTPLPIYLSLKTFAGGDAETLLEMAAFANKVEPDTLRTWWSSPNRPICLLFDGGDETMFRDELIEAVAELGKVLTLPNADGSDGSRAELRSLIVACHPGPLQQQLAKVDPSWREFLLMPLGAGDIQTMLKAYDAVDLIPLLDDRLRQTIRQPDLLSALAQSARDRPGNLIPRNAAGIYDLYLLHIFSALRSPYDYERVQRPMLANIASTMVRNKHTAIACDDALYDSLASRLEEIHRRYYRRRRVMPSDWNAQDLHDELLRSPVVDVAAGQGEALTFSKAIYRDYFVAEYLKMVGADSQEARELVSGLHEREYLQPLSFLLGMSPDSATLFDAVPPEAMPGAGEIWLEDRVANIAVPASIRNAYRQWCARVQACTLDGTETIAKARLAALRDGDPRTRFEAVTAIAKGQPMPASVLLEAAEDDHPLIRAVAQFALLHAGDPCAALRVDNRDGGFRWESYGGGNARIGSLKLLRVPVPMLIALSVRITDSDIDIFTSDAEFSFIPMPPALFAAGLFAAKNVDWLELLARFRAVAQESELLARLAASRPRLAEFTQQLGHRARSYSEVGFLLANDLGLDWETGEVVTGFQTPSQEAMQTYKDLRRLFSRANQAHTRRLAHLVDDSVVNVELRIDKVEKDGKAVGLQVARMNGSSSDDADEATPIVFINSSHRVETVQGGTLHGIEIARARYSSGMLPIYVHINDAIRVEDVKDGTVAAILVSRLESATCPWRINASVQIDHFVNSSFVGVSVEEYQPA